MKKFKRINCLVMICIFSGILNYGIKSAQAIVPPDTDNAALLYYQAFQYLPDVCNVSVDIDLQDYGKAVPDNSLSAFIADGINALRLAGNASQLCNCNWGVQYSRGFNYLMPYIAMKNLAFILRVDLYVSIAEHRYQDTWKRCFMMRRYAEHLCCMHTDLGYALSLSVDSYALQCIQYLLGILPSDKTRLKSLQGQLFSGNFSKNFSDTLYTTLEMAIETMRNDKKTMNMVRLQYLKNLIDSNCPTDKELVLNARKITTEFLSCALRIIESNTSIIKKYNELQKFIATTKEENSNNYAAHTLICTLSPTVMRLLAVRIKHKSQFNAVKNAIEIYLLAVGDGELPKKIPCNLFKDPYSCKEFKYEILDGGFILRCNAEDVFACPLALGNNSFNASEYKCTTYEYMFRYNLTQRLGTQ